MSGSNQIKAAILFYSLPGNVQKKIEGLIPSSYLHKLEAAHVSGILKNHYNKKTYSEITVSLNRQRAKKVSHENIYAGVFYFLNLSGAILALVQSNFITALSCFIYAIAGFFYFSSRSDTWLKIRFSLKPFVFLHLAMAVGAYVIILPITGYLSSEYPVEKTGLSLLYQGMILAPLFEEIFFRDFLYTYFRDLFLSEGFSVVFTGIFFSLVHLQSPDDIAGLAVYFISGCILGAIRAVTKNLVYPIAVHSAVNTTLFFI